MDRKRFLRLPCLTTLHGFAATLFAAGLCATRRVSWFVFLCSGVLYVTAGCSTVSLQPQWPWSKNDADTLLLPDRILVIWSDTTLHQPGLPAVRGFGGRVFFYLKDRPEPVQVDGALTVLAFGGEPENVIQHPEKKFVFTVDQLPGHYAKCKLGHSYNIWIPWGATEGSTRQIHLMARFEGRDGGIVFSEGVTKLLPGAKPAISATENGSLSTIRQPSVAPAGYREVDDNPQQTEMRVHAIDLPPDFARRLSPRARQPDRAAAPSTLRPPTPGTTSKTVTPAVSEPAVVPRPAAESSTRSGFRRFQGKSGLRSPPTPAGVRRQPHPAAWPAALPPTPRTGFRSLRETGESNASPIPRPAPPQSVN
ncbi:MAG: hypothetical protein CMJ75_16920 [Planctomycetaceae bacterium]|nr:hypothetical protein [Planctomycetaceae bacterium]